MISRIYVRPKEGVKKADSYLIDSNLSRTKLEKLAQALTNPILDEYSIDNLEVLPPFGGRTSKFNYAIEIGFLPGVTDNVGHTVKEMAADLLHLKNNSDFHVYTSKIFFVKSRKLEDVKKYSLTLYNPLIERENIVEVKSGKINLPNKIPKVILRKSIAVIDVPLSVSNEELIKIGKEGIMDEKGIRRGPLALDLISMQAIREHFLKLKRDPTDIELESLAQTWSEHCKHTIFANPIDDIRDGLYKT